MREMQGPRPAGGGSGAPLRLIVAAILLVVLGAGLACSAGTGGMELSAPTIKPVAGDASPQSNVAGPSQAPPAVAGPVSRAEPSRRVSTTMSGLTQAAAPSGVASFAGLAEQRKGHANGEATVTDPAAPTVEELLERGLHRAGASPVHLAMRGTPAADSVRCAWRGIARTATQRAEAIRFWLRLNATEAIPRVSTLEVLFAVVLDALDPDYRETAKANFLAIARGGESMEYLFLTCFADYAVTAFLLGTGTTPATVTVGYDRRGEAASYDLYVRELEAGTYGDAALPTRGAYEAGLQAQVVAAEKSLSEEIGGREAVVFLAPMGAHNAIGFEAWQ